MDMFDCTTTGRLIFDDIIYSFNPLKWICLTAPRSFNAQPGDNISSFQPSKMDMFDCTRPLKPSRYKFLALFDCDSSSQMFFLHKTLGQLRNWYYLFSPQLPLIELLPPYRGGRFQSLLENPFNWVQFELGFLTLLYS